MKLLPSGVLVLGLQNFALVWPDESCTLIKSCACGFWITLWKQNCWLQDTILLYENWRQSVKSYLEEA